MVFSSAVLFGTKKNGLKDDVKNGVKRGLKSGLQDGFDGSNGPRDLYKESIVYYAESSLPGYSALAFIDTKGHGAVFLANTNDLFFLRTLQRYAYHLFGIMNLETEYSFSQVQAQKSKDFQGSYRPLGPLPENYRFLDFLNELQIRHTDKGIELSSFFEKKVSVHLFPLKKNLYIARGAASMDGWRILLRHDKEGNTIGFDTDLLRYERIPKLLSAPSILIGLSILAGLPIFGLLLYYLFRKRSF